MCVESTPAYNLPKTSSQDQFLLVRSNDRDNTLAEEKKIDKNVVGKAKSFTFPDNNDRCSHGNPIRTDNASLALVV